MVDLEHVSSMVLSEPRYCGQCACVEKIIKFDKTQAYNSNIWTYVASNPKGKKISIVVITEKV